MIDAIVTRPNTTKISQFYIITNKQHIRYT